MDIEFIEEVADVLPTHFIKDISFETVRGELVMKITKGKIDWTKIKVVQAIEGTDGERKLQCRTFTVVPAAFPVEQS